MCQINFWKFEIVKWPTPPDHAINILSDCVKVEFIGNQGVELCEKSGHIDFAMCEINLEDLCQLSDLGVWKKAPPRKKPPIRKNK